MARDDFSPATKNLLAQRTGYKCSNPNCNQLTIGAQINDEGSVNVGETAHICAASPGGKRYDPTMTPQQRKSSENGIWLCSLCAALIDRNENEYTVDLLKKWKRLAENESHRQLLTRNKHDTHTPNAQEAFRLSCIVRDLSIYNKWFPLFDALASPVFDIKNFPLRPDWQEVVEDSIKILGIDLALGLRSVLSNVEILRKLMTDEKSRIQRTYPKSSSGRIMDVGAVKYGNALKGVILILKVN